MLRAHDNISRHKKLVLISWIRNDRYFVILVLISNMVFYLHKNKIEVKSLHML